MIRNAAEMKELAEKLGVMHDWHEPDNQGVTLSVNIPLNARGSSTVIGFPNPDGPDEDVMFWARPRLDTGRFAFDNARGDEAEAYLTIHQNGKPVAHVNLAYLLAFACGYQGRD